MSIVKNLEWTFDTIADEYDNRTPNYPSELYLDIFNSVSINCFSKVMEIGIGTGQVTLPFLNKGCCLTAVELGKNLTAITKKKYENFKNFHIVNADFHNYVCKDNTYDLIYSAGAFHWIDEKIGYTKVFNALKTKGVFARFANHPNYADGQDELKHTMQEAYSRLMPYSNLSPHYSMNDAQNISKLALNYGFKSIDSKIYTRIRYYNADEYISLINTYSDHIILDKDKKEKLYGTIKSAIISNGDIIKIQDTLELNIAYKF